MNKGFYILCIFRVTDGVDELSSCSRIGENDANSNDDDDVKFSLRDIP